MASYLVQASYSTQGTAAMIKKPQDRAAAVRPVIESDVHSKEVVAWWNEMKAGNGPICANMAENVINNEIAPAFHTDAMASRPVSTAFWKLTIGKAMAALRKVAPDSGAYVAESSFFQADWQRAYWGANYQHLREVKRAYDPDGLFYAHHGVGSEDWSDDGFTRIAGH